MKREKATNTNGCLSLDEPDPAIDALWLEEAKSRMAAHRSGELDAIDADQVFAELGRRLDRLAVNSLGITLAAERCSL